MRDWVGDKRQKEIYYRTPVRQKHNDDQYDDLDALSTKDFFIFVGQYFGEILSQQISFSQNPTLVTRGVKVLNCNITWWVNCYVRKCNVVGELTKSPKSTKNITRKIAYEGVCAGIIKLTKMILTNLTACYGITPTETLNYSTGRFLFLFFRGCHFMSHLPFKAKWIYFDHERIVKGYITFTGAYRWNCISVMMFFRVNYDYSFQFLKKPWNFAKRKKKNYKKNIPRKQNSKFPSRLE